MFLLCPYFISKTIWKENQQIFKKSILTKKIKLEFEFEVIQNCLEPIPNTFCIVVVVDFSNLIKRISYNLCYVISKMLILCACNFRFNIPFKKKLFKGSFGNLYFFFKVDKTINNVSLKNLIFEIG